MRVFGDPKGTNQAVIDRVNRIRVLKVTDEDYLRSQVENLVDSDTVILDCGQSLRHFSNSIKEKVRLLETLDINQFENYPDYLVDVCDSKGMSFFKDRYDLVIAFSLLEHCHNPFWASENLFLSLKKGGKIVGSAPFLFPRHGPSDIAYQDFWRFSRDAYAMLFPEASSIVLYPLRGRVATAINVLSLRYRFSFEKKWRLLSKLVNQIGSRRGNELQSSGYGFVITK